MGAIWSRYWAKDVSESRRALHLWVGSIEARGIANTSQYGTRCHLRPDTTTAPWRGYRTHSNTNAVARTNHGCVQATFVCVVRRGRLCTANRLRQCRWSTTVSD